MIGVESRAIQPENTRSLASGNAARPEFDPSRVRPGFTDYLRKVGASESLIRKVERQNERRQLAEQKPGRRLQAIPKETVFCLDASQLDGYSEVEAFTTQYGAGIQRIFDVLPIVQNKCSEQADHVTFTVEAKMHCVEQDFPWLGEVQGIDNNLPNPPATIFACRWVEVLQDCIWKMSSTSSRAS